MNPLLLTDGYKLSHREQYPKGTTKVYSNFTPRKSRIKGVNYIINFGTQYVIRKLKQDFEKFFFSQPKEYVCRQYQIYVEAYLGTKYDVSHIEELHDLGYLPLEFKALPEGTRVPIRVPILTVTNTLPEFYWLVNYLETLISNMLWQPMTSATISNEYRQLFEDWAERTGSKSDIIPDLLNNVDIQGHDFSMRGMSGVESAVSSGMGHAISFKGSDTLPVMQALDEYYDAKDDFKICSVPATEHSVMCAGSKDGEFETFKRLITETYPTGIVSIVSDTWNLWKVLTDYLPRLKDEIMARDGKVVIRPDSGDPADIICGDRNLEDKDLPIEITKGVVELLWDTFGGITNEKGFKVLDPHIGCIYGDSITLDRAEDICSRLANKGFASTNWVAGIGSYTYQYNTRDTFGFAMKATYVEVKSKKMDARGSVEGREIFKDPITDDGTKKSAKGLLMVQRNETNGDYELIDQVSWDDEVKGELKTVFKDGSLENQTSLSEIRNKLTKWNTLENV